jgi:hypothetical protein
MRRVSPQRTAVSLREAPTIAPVMVMRGVHKDLEYRAHEQRESPSRFRRKTAEGRELRNALSHRLDDPPNARIVSPIL